MEADLKKKKKKKRWKTTSKKNKKEQFRLSIYDEILATLYIFVR